jgi:hypothetical protein
MKLHEIVLTEKITFDDSEFIRAHGKKPQGTGLWFFRVEIPGQEDKVIEVRMKNLVTAKKEVAAQLADDLRKDPRVFVLP